MSVRCGDILPRVCDFYRRHGPLNGRTFQFRDSTGAATQNFSDATTASINFVHHRYGIVFDSSAAGMRHRGIDRTHNLIVSGLLGHEVQRTWNGTGNSLDSGTVVNAKATYSYNWAVAGTLTNVVRKLPASSNKFPMSGKTYTLDLVSYKLTATY
ncbi:MAG: hypothetical protein ACR2MQ_13465 [Gemmatimonadaceae bacterium]